MAPTTKSERVSLSAGSGGHSLFCYMTVASLPHHKKYRAAQNANFLIINMFKKLLREVILAQVLYSKFHQDWPSHLGANLEQSTGLVAPSQSHTKSSLALLDLDKHFILEVTLKFQISEGVDSFKTRSLPHRIWQMG